MQAHLTTGHTEARRVLEIVSGAIVVAILVVAFIVASLGLGYEGTVGHGPIPAPASAPIALEAN